MNTKRLKRFFARVRYRTIVERDLRHIRRRYGPVLAPAARAAGERVALFVSLSGFIYQLKLEAMLAKALELKGCRPVFAVLPGSSIPRRYFEAFGFDRSLKLGDYVTDEHEREARAEAASILRDDVTVPSLKALEFRGIPIGRPALATVSRLLHQGHVELSDPGARELLGEMLTTVIRSTLASERLIDALRPDIVVFNERNYAAEAPLSEIALLRGVNVVQFVSAFQDDGLVFKRFTAETRRVHPRSLSDESWEQVRAIEWTDERQEELDREFSRRYETMSGLARLNHGWTRPRPREEIVAELGLDPAKKTAVIFSHILWDANMFYGEDLFVDQQDWFVETVRAACANSRVNWIVKLHPANVWKRRRDGVEGELSDLVTLRQGVGVLPPHVALMYPDSDISTRSIFELADYGITIRGSIGIELPCFGVPVLTAGTGFYSGRGFTTDSRTAPEYLERLRTIDDIPPLAPDQVELARKHAYAIFRLRPTRFTTFRSTFRALAETGHPLDQDLELTIGSRDELARADDLRRFGEWALESEALDYLERPRERSGAPVGR